MSTEESATGARQHASADAAPELYEEIYDE
jgi:hypothetical protein